MTAREIALKGLEAFRRDGAWPDYVLTALCDRQGVAQRDASLAWRLAFGVIQNMALLDYYISHYSTMPRRKLHPRVHDILRISVYQLVFLSKIPRSAAVNEGVKLAAKLSNQRGAGYVNAVLRKISKDASDGKLPEVKADSDNRRLSVLYSHPEWLVGEITGRLGEQEAEALLALNNSADSSVFAQINTLQADEASVIALLSTEGIEAAEHGRLDGCIMINEAGDIRRISAFTDGMIYIQDPASRLAVMAAGAKPGDFVIDGCSAPGGKSFAAAIMMQNEGSILACDINIKKLRLIEEGSARLGINIIETALKDSSETDKQLIGKADIVLADVPCSGVGVIRKKPEIRYKTEQSIDGLPELQMKIVSNLSRYVKPGGILLYSTCSVLCRENEDVVNSFLRENGDFAKEGFTLPGIGEAHGGTFTLWPHLHMTDGFFICKMRRSCV